MLSQHTGQRWVEGPPSKTLTFPPSTAARSSESFFHVEHLRGWLPVLLPLSNLFSGTQRLCVLRSSGGRGLTFAVTAGVAVCAMGLGWGVGLALVVSFLGNGVRS